MMDKYRLLNALVFHRILVLLLLPLRHDVHAWRQWTWSGSEAPDARRGHSMVFYDDQLIVFGGRTEDASKTHIPKTYEITEGSDGALEFLAYEDKVIRPNCTRYADESCRDSTWQELRAGAEWGGCNIVYGAKVCSHPAERWYHRAEVFTSDNTMLIYGGFSLLCDDYCNDMWQFEFEDNSWTELMEIGNSAYGPGKRFKFSSVVIDDKMYIFGGFRLWHGFALANSVENDWNDTTKYPRGGYLNDLWVYDKNSNAWTNITEKMNCPTQTQLEAIENTEVECHVTWPPSRAGHTAVVYNDGIFVHGGYRTFFPYPTTTSAGAGRGTLTITGTGFTPFPTHPYYLSDFWLYNLTTGQWTELMANVNGNATSKPGPRMEHSMVFVEKSDMFVLFGGYISNYYYDDTWQFNISAQRWVRQNTFVHAIYNKTCTDDLWARKLPYSGNYAAFVVPSNVSDDLGGYYFIKERHYGTFTFSVFAEPTRGYDYASPVFINQARRQAPGWDGCRDRNDGRTDLPQELQWAHPSQRAGHTMAYHSTFDQIFLFGGYGFDEEQLYQVNTTEAVASLGDLWQYNPNNCVKNCSLHGQCLAGNCRCNDGYYGVDCSNSSCPGSFCTYNDATQTQICEHCCFSGFEHTNNDSYVENVQKYPCTSDNIHYSNGICDGFGKCICRPPFIGEDCSIRDCGRNCSGHGYCSVEFPNSRCMCDEGWFGKYCSERLCLNNCSYPNGVCVNGSCYCDMVYEPYNNTLQYFPFMGEDCSFLIPFARAVYVTRASIVAVMVAFALCGWVVAPDG